MIRPEWKSRCREIVDGTPNWMLFLFAAVLGLPLMLAGALIALALTLIFAVSSVPVGVLLVACYGIAFVIIGVLELSDMILSYLTKK